MHTQMSGNQSLFSKSKMAATNFSQSGAKLRIQDGGKGSDMLSSRETWKPGLKVSIETRMNAGGCFGREKMEQSYFYLT